MESLHAHWLLVVDNSHLVGIIGVRDLMGRAAVKLQQQRRIAREEITNKMLMTPIEQLPCVHRSSLKYAQVGHVITTLQSSGAHYLLLVASAENESSPSIVGVFDRVGINHLLHEQVFDSLSG